MKMDVLDRKVRGRTENPNGNGFLMNRTVKRISSQKRKKTNKVNSVLGITIFK